jgi:hypothetical protein
MAKKLRLAGLDQERLMNQPLASVRTLGRDACTVIVRCRRGKDGKSALALLYLGETPAPRLDQEHSPAIAPSPFQSPAKLPFPMASRVAEWHKLPISLTELCINTTLRCGQSFRYIP